MSGYLGPGNGQWEDVWTAACRCLSPQQQQVIQMTHDGWSIRDIAQRLDLPTDRVSDAKYRAIGKLKKALV
jgi:RNA polymerase sigma factor (sigma-70 family)